MAAENTLLVFFLQVAFFISCVAAVYATAILESGVVAPTLISSGIIHPGLFNSRIIAPGVVKSGYAVPGILTSGYVSSGLAYNDAPVIAAPASAVAPSAITASSVVARDGPIDRYDGPTDQRIIGTTTVLTGEPLSRRLQEAPISVNRGISSPMGLRDTGILAGPGAIKTLLK